MLLDRAGRIDDVADGSFVISEAPKHVTRRVRHSQDLVDGTPVEITLRQFGRVTCTVQPVGVGQFQGQFVAAVNVIEAVVGALVLVTSAIAKSHARIPLDRTRFV